VFKKSIIGIEEEENCDPTSAQKEPLCVGIFDADDPEFVDAWACALRYCVCATTVRPPTFVALRKDIVANLVWEYPCPHSYALGRQP
jgi:hypothetical protein